MQNSRNTPTDTTNTDDAEGHKRHRRIEPAGEEHDAEGHKRYRRIEPAGEKDDAEGHKRQRGR